MYSYSTDFALKADKKFFFFRSNQSLTQTDGKGEDDEKSKMLREKEAEVSINIRLFTIENC